jgi:hypothetical protein
MQNRAFSVATALANALMETPNRIKAIGRKHAKSGKIPYKASLFKARTGWIELQ